MGDAIPKTIKVSTYLVRTGKKERRKEDLVSSCAHGAGKQQSKEVMYFKSQSNEYSVERSLAASHKDFLTADTLAEMKKRKEKMCTHLLCLT